MLAERVRISTGLTELDVILGKLFVGDNVIWYDESGNLAYFFCLSLMETSLADKEPVVYVSFDRSLRNLFEKLGPLAKDPQLTILDCFTHGKGKSSDVFVRFYEEERYKWPCRILQVNEPSNMDEVMDAVYGIQDSLEGIVRFVFESLTGMQTLWGGEGAIINFYGESCPRLYELNTVAYWIIEKLAHSSRLRANLNKITQVAIDLAVKRGKESLTILKAEDHEVDKLNEPVYYWFKGKRISFDSKMGSAVKIDLGARLKEFRARRGITQTELSKLVGVTPSSISQIESGTIYPSLPALIKISEILSVDISSFFQESFGTKSRAVFLSSEAVEVKLAEVPESNIHAKLLTPVDFNPQAEPFLVEIPPNTKLPSHFFKHKGDEMGYVLSGRLQAKLDKTVYEVQAGDTFYLTSNVPSHWENPGPRSAKLLWIKVKTTKSSLPESVFSPTSQE